jgi:hypothetical protein
MSRLLVHVEGETEETFVNEVLRPHLTDAGYLSVGARLLGNARARSRRGGITSWDTVKRDLIRHLAGDLGCIATTMVDYYALPDNWPGRSQSSTLPIHLRADAMHQALAQDLVSSTPYGLRFEPFVLMHEFEALLFSDCAKFASAVGETTRAAQMQEVRDQFASPEHINDSPLTAPSKRLGKIIPSYHKVISGTVGILEIGLLTIRAQCPGFDNWLTRLEQRA